MTKPAYAAKRGIQTLIERQELRYQALAMQREILRLEDAALAKLQQLSREDQHNHGCGHDL